MAHNFVSSGNRLTVGSQTVAGITNPQKLPYEKSLQGGLSILNGPVQIGVAPLSPVPKGVIDVGPSTPTSGPPALAAINVTHPVKGVQITSTAIGFQVAAPTNIVLGNINITGNVVLTGNLTGTGTCTFPTFQGNINVQGWKGFDIKHPTKDGHRLRYICLEGPEGGVYHRGRITGTNVINLPDYWKDLVDIDSISVQLQPIGRQQNLVIQEIDEDFIVIVEDSTNTDLITDLSTIDCFYHIYGTRKDGEVLIPEYKGETPEDYPGNNNQYSIAGYHYDRRTL